MIYWIGNLERREQNEKINTKLWGFKNPFKKKELKSCFSTVIKRSNYFNCSVYIVINLLYYD